MKRFLCMALSIALLALALTGCGGGSSSGAASNATGAITVVSREDGSGTRGAFVELMGIEQKNTSGEKVDMTTVNSTITNSTSVVMTTVAGDPNAIGYISMGSMNDTIKALSIDGVAATTENVLSGSYKVSRPFNIATKEGLSAVAQDFLDFIVSADGQKVVQASGYIPLEATRAYSGSKPSGKIVVAGSSSVTPVMEKLKEAYLAVNTGAQIDIQQSDSSTGMSSVSEGICDIGMASRELKDSETAQGLTATVIALDGIAVVVNQKNACTNLTTEQVRSIFTGEVTTWDAL